MAQIFSPPGVGAPQLRIPRVTRRTTTPDFAPASGQAAVDEGQAPSTSLRDQIRDQSVHDLDALGNVSINAQTPAPAKPSIGQRILGAFANSPNVFNPESSNFGQAFLGTALGGFQSSLAARRAGETQADRLDLLERGHQNRLNEIIATGDQNRKSRTAAAGPQAGKVSQVDAAILRRYEMGTRTGHAAVSAAERANYGDPVANEPSIFSKAAREANPSFAADSAVSEGRILPAMRGTIPGPPPPMEGVTGGHSTGAPIDQKTHDTLRQFSRRQGGGGAAPAGGTSAPVSGELDPGELEDAAGIITGLDDASARALLRRSGYADDHIEKILQYSKDQDLEGTLGQEEQP